MFNSVTLVQDSEIVDEERFAQLKGFPFIHIKSIEDVLADSDTEVHGLGGVTAAFRRMWEDGAEKRLDQDYDNAFAEGF